jgi:hypothetical protein
MKKGKKQVMRKRKRNVNRKKRLKEEEGTVKRRGFS